MLIRCHARGVGPVSINVDALVSINAVLPAADGTGGGTLIRTTDGRDWTVTDTVDEVIAALGAAHKMERERVDGDGKKPKHMR